MLPHSQRPKRKSKVYLYALSAITAFNGGLNKVERWKEIFLFIPKTNKDPWEFNLVWRDSQLIKGKQRLSDWEKPRSTKFKPSGLDRVLTTLSGTLTSGS